ncbi:MAG: ATP-binding protein [bacterium]|nr:ATP-binding protein [bacterium]
MIVNYSFKNFRSYYDMQEFSMAAKSYNDNEQNLQEIDDSIATKSNKLLKSAILLGCNGAGKSNFVASLGYLTYLIKKSYVNFQNNRQTSFFASEKFKFIDEAKNEPTCFNIEFIANDNNNYCYELELDVDKDIPFVRKETLSKRLNNGKNRLAFSQYIFHRNFDEIVEGDNSIMNLFNFIKPQKEFLLLSYLFTSNLNDNILELINPVKNWFNNLCIIEADTEIMIDLNLITEKDLDFVTKIISAYTRPLSRIVKSNNQLDIMPEELRTPQVAINTLNKKYPNGLPGVITILQNGVFAQDLIGIFNIFNSDGKQTGDFKYSIFDTSSRILSKGEKKIIFLMLYIKQALDKGSVILVDEMETSLHKNVCELIIDMFNDNDVNKNKAQAIFTTQNINMIDYNFRKDQVFLIRKDQMWGKSNISSLAQISKTEKVIRKDVKLSKIFEKEIEGTTSPINLNLIKTILN